MPNPVRRTCDKTVVTLMVLLTLTPMSCAAPLSSETACIAEPIRVWLMNAVRAIIITMVAAIVRIASPVTVSPSATCQSGRFKMSGKFLDAEPKISSAMFWRK